MVQVGGVPVRQMQREFVPDVAYAKRHHVLATVAVRRTRRRAVIGLRHLWEVIPLIRSVAEVHATVCEPVRVQ